MNNSQEILNIIMQYINKSSKNSKECLIACGINTSFLTDWKAGKIKNPSYDKIVKLADYLNIDIGWLFTGKEKSSSLDVDEHEKELLNCYRKLSDFDKGEVLGDIKRRAANVEQVKKPNIQRVYQAARTYDHKPVSSVIEADITPLLEAPDATDEY